MKKLITKSLAFFVLLFLIPWSANAATTHPITVAEEFSCSATNIAASTWVTYTAGSYSARTNACDNGSFPNLSSSARTVVFYVSGCASFTITADGNSTPRTLSYLVSGGSAVTTAGYGAGCSAQTFNTGNTGAVTISISGVSASVYLGSVKFFPPATPSISAFTASGISATINESSTPKTITAVLPYGTNMTSITPTVTYGGSAIGYSPSGAQDFSASATTPVIYSATDGVITTNYSVTLTANPTASSAKDLSAVTIGGYTPVFNSSTNTYSVVLPKTASLTQAVTFANSIASTTDFTSGNTFNFSAPLTINVTAQDNTTKAFTLQAANGIADIAYVTVDGTVGATDTKVYPDLVSKGYYVKLINAATGSDITQFNNYDLTILTESPSSSNALATAMSGLIGVKPFLSMKSFLYGKTGWPTGAGANGTSDVNASIKNCYLSHPVFAGVTFDGNNASILTAGITGNGVQGVTAPGSGIFIGYLPSAPTLPAIIEVNTNPGAKYFLIPLSTVNYNMVNASGLKLIENTVSYLLGSTVYSLPSLEISSFTVNSVAATIDNTAGTITAQFPLATDLTTLQPAIVLTGATTTVSPLSGVATDFSNSYVTPVNYTVTDGCNTKVYAVTLTVGGTGISTPTMAGVSFDGTTIQNASSLDLQVFDVTGRLVVRSTKNITMSSNPKGVYIIKNNSGTLKIVL